MKKLARLGRMSRKGGIRPSEFSREGIHYDAANKGNIPNEGETAIAFEAEEGFVKGLRVQVANVNRLLCSANSVAKAGHRTVLDNNTGTIEDLKTGAKMRLRVANGVYVLRGKILPAHVAEAMGFARQVY